MLPSWALLLLDAACHGAACHGSATPVAPQVRSLSWVNVGVFEIFALLAEAPALHACWPQDLAGHLLAGPAEPPLPSGSGSGACVALA